MHIVVVLNEAILAIVAGITDITSKYIIALFQIIYRVFIWMFFRYIGVYVFSIYMSCKYNWTKVYDTWHLQYSSWSDMT